MQLNYKSFSLFCNVTRAVTLKYNSLYNKCIWHLKCSAQETVVATNILLFPEVSDSYYILRAFLQLDLKKKIFSKDTTTSPLYVRSLGKYGS